MFVIGAILILNIGHATDSVLSSLANAKRIETANYLVDLQAIRTHVIHEYEEYYEANEGDHSATVVELLEHFAEENYISYFHLSSSALLSIRFGDQKHDTSLNLAEDEQVSIQSFLTNNKAPNTLVADAHDHRMEDGANFDFANIGEGEYLVTLAPIQEFGGQILFAQKSVAKNIALRTAAIRSALFSFAVFLVGIWFAVFLSRLIGKRIDQSNNSIERALKAEMQINAKLEEIVSERTKELEAAKDAAELANRSKSSFLANMSHEIRTPMNGVVGMAELLNKSDISADHKDMLQTIVTSGHSLLRIIDDILDFSKIEAGKMNVELDEVRLRDLAEGVALTMVPAAFENNVHISLLLGTKVPEIILSDVVRLRQIIINLVSNAIKFSKKPDGDGAGKVLLQLDILEDNILEIKVADNGVGMSTENAETLFKPFTQAEPSTTRRFGGSGLGLSITKNLVELFGGEISVQSTEGMGSVFTVRLPVQIVQEKKHVELDRHVSVAMLFDTEMNPVKDEPNRPLLRGSSTHCFSDLAALEAGISELSGDIIVGLALGSDEENLRARDQLLEKNSALKFMLISDNRGAETGLTADGCYTVLRNPILSSAAELAVLTLLGKAKADPDVEPTRKREVTNQNDHQVQSGDVLLVEDNVTNQKVIAMQLKTLGYTVQIASNGEEALQMYKSRDHHLILSDCHMPVMDGFEMTKAIRTFDEEVVKTRIPIIAITANAIKGEKEFCLAAGFDDYLSKPVNINQLKSTLKRWIG